MVAPGAAGGATVAGTVVVGASVVVAAAVVGVPPSDVDTPAVVDGTVIAGSTGGSGTPTTDVAVGGGTVCPAGGTLPCPSSCCSARDGPALTVVTAISSRTAAPASAIGPARRRAPSRSFSRCRHRWNAPLRIGTSTNR